MNTRTALFFVMLIALANASILTDVRSAVPVTYNDVLAYHTVITFNTHIEKLWRGEPGFLYALTSKGELLRIDTKEGKVVAFAKLSGKPLELMATNKRTFVFMNDGIYVMNKALALLKKISLNLTGLDPSGVTPSCKWFHAREYLIGVCNDNVYLFRVPKDEIPVMAPFGPIAVPLWRLSAACAINVTDYSFTYVGGITYVALNSKNNSALAEISFKNGMIMLLNCIHYNSKISLYNTTLKLIGKNKVLLEDLLSRTKVTVLNALNADVLGFQRSSLGYETVIIATKRPDFILSVRTKDSVPLFSMSSNKLMCVMEKSLYCYIPQLRSLVRFNNLAMPYSVLELSLTPNFAKLTGSNTIKMTLQALSSSTKYVVTVKAPKFTRSIEVPSDLYLLSITTEIGRVIVFVPAPPPKVTFDPTVIPIKITPEVIIPYIYKLTIKVIDAQSGKPVPDASVYITGTTVRGKVINIGPLLTDENGVVSIHLEKGKYKIMVSKTYYKPYVTTITLSKDTTLLVKLMLKGTTVYIRVLSKGIKPFINPGPVPNANVTVKGRITLTKTTDQKGLVKVVLLPGLYKLVVTAKAHEPYKGTLTVPPGKNVITKNVVLNPLVYNVTLIVKDALTGKPVIPSLVSITSLTTGRTKVIKNPPTNTILVSLPPDTYRFLVQAPNYVPYQRVFSINKNVELIIPMKLKTVKVRFLVFDELKNLVPSFNITLVNKYLGLKFKFSLTANNNTVNIPPGTYVVTVTAKGFEPLITTIKITDKTKIIQLTIAHKSFRVIIKAVTNDKLLYEYISYCKGTVKGGPLFEPLPLPKMTKPTLEAVVKLPRGTYVVSLTCYSATGREAATGRSTFTVPFKTRVDVPLTPTKVTITITVKDVRTGRPIPRATVKIYADKALTKLIGEGVTNVIGVAKILVNSYYLGKPAWIVVTAPGYQEYKSPVILTERLPVVYLKPAPTLIEIILGNPILLIAIVLVAAAGAYLISMMLGGRGEEEEIFEELV